MKHMSFAEFMKEDTSSADVANVDTKLDLVKRKEVDEDTAIKPFEDGEDNIKDTESSTETE